MSEVLFPVSLSCIMDVLSCPIPFVLPAARSKCFWRNPVKITWPAFHFPRWYLADLINYLVSCVSNSEMYPSQKDHAYIFNSCPLESQHLELKGLNPIMGFHASWQAPGRWYFGAKELLKPLKPQHVGSHVFSPTVNALPRPMGKWTSRSYAISHKGEFPNCNTRYTPPPHHHRIKKYVAYTSI